MSITHTQACQEQQQRYSDWIAKWPNACKTCGATGVLHDPGVWMYPDGSGQPPSDDPCESCTAKENPEHADDYDHGYCPRCMTWGLDTTGLIDSTCPTCGWA